MKKLLFLILFITAGMNAQEQSFKDDVQKLIKAMGVPERIDAMREYQRMWTKPEEEAEYMPVFETTVPLFLQNVEEYYLTKYTHEEVKELLDFYNSPLGKKVTANATAINIAYSDAKDLWSDMFNEIFYKYYKKK